MREAYNAAKVGVLVVLTVVVGIATYRFVDETAGGEDTYPAHVIFDDVQGLVPKSRVLVAGIPVGIIEKISLEGDRARVDLRIQRSVKLYENASVAQRSASLLGESLLVIRPGGPPAPELKDGGQIAAEAAAAKTDDVLQTVSEIAKSVQRVTSQLERAFGNDVAGQQMAEALRNLTEALESVNRTVQANEEAVSRTLHNFENITTDAAPKIERILSNVESVTQDIHLIVGNNQEGISRGLARVDDTVASIQRSAEELESVMEDIKAITGRTAGGEGTIGRLTKDETLINEVEGVVDDLRSVTAPIRRLQTIVRLRSEYNFLANTFKSYVGLRLAPREDYYYKFELINDPRGRTTFTQRQVRVSPPAEGEPEFYQETVSETKDTFRFSLLFAKRLYFATFRFGILESTGGLGLDVHLLDDHLEINSDVFAIGEKQYARLRVALAYEVVQRLWLVGGMDDMLNPSRDFFLGAQLKFNDEDLKSILPFVPSTPG